jgi:hypothetical protein
LKKVWKENWSGKQRMEEIKKMKVKDLKKECLRRKLPTKGNKSELATRLKENGFKISTEPIPVVPILPRDNLETYVTDRIAENDAHSLASILKNNLHHNDKNKQKRFTMMNFSKLAYEKYIEGHGKKRRTTKKVKRFGRMVRHQRIHHSFKQVTDTPSRMVDKNGFIQLDEENTNYWNFEYVTPSALNGVEVFAKVALVDLKFCYDLENKMLRVKVIYAGFWRDTLNQIWKWSI